MEHTSTYNVIKNRFENGRTFTKSEAHKWIDSYARLLDPNVLTQEEATELHAMADQLGVDILPTDAEGRLDEHDLKIEANAAQATYTAMMTDTLMEV